MRQTNTVSNQPIYHFTGRINKQHAAATVQVKSPVCERTCGVLGKGGWEEAD